VRPKGGIPDRPGEVGDGGSGISERVALEWLRKCVERAAIDDSHPCKLDTRGSAREDGVGPIGKRVGERAEDVEEKSRGAGAISGYYPQQNRRYHRLKVKSGLEYIL
jgi:hypothetical protein